MADTERRFLVEGSRCIRCAACTSLAPGIFEMKDGPSRVVRQPRVSEVSRCEAALLNCPTSAIRAKSESVEADLSVPIESTTNLFDILAIEAEAARWKLGDIAWDKVNPSVVTPDVRTLVREMAFSEHATYSATQRFLQDFYDDVDITRWVAIWFYEETRHPHVLMQWLSHCGETFGDDFVQRARVSTPFMKSRIGTLVTNVISEVTAAHAYHTLARTTAEPVLAKIAMNIAGDEARHAASFFRFARLRIEHAENPERARIDGLKVLSAWLSGTGHVTHPVNQMLERLEAAPPAGVTGIDFGSVKTRVIRILGLLLDLPLRAPEDVDIHLRAFVAGRPI
ncbi:MAG: ferredoxin [Polyangiaceae bacterium]|nr:ferredoxin [Polyangiaceae bacterium]